jgi:hypothetical protein
VIYSYEKITGCPYEKGVRSEGPCFPPGSGLPADANALELTAEVLCTEIDTYANIDTEADIEIEKRPRPQKFDGPLRCNLARVHILDRSNETSTTTLTLTMTSIPTLTPTLTPTQTLTLTSTRTSISKNSRVHTLCGRARVHINSTGR